jgi:NAD(P)-dependent dehydrogenase (short-subunit alcohol dehydrogenase family)
MKRTVVITGATAGLGLATAQVLAANGWHVIVAARSLERGEAACRRIGGSCETRLLDVASLPSVRAFAAITAPPDALVCNAGIQETGAATLVAGIDATFATNHLGHFLLAQLVPAPTTIFVSSNTHDPRNLTGMPRPDVADLQALVTGTLPPRTRYTTSKLCNVLCAYELARRHPERRVLAFDPGAMPGTDLARDYRGIARFAWRYLLPVATLIVRNVNRVTTSARRLADLVERDVPTASYISRGRITPSSAQSYDTAVAGALWQLSDELCARS